MSTPEYSLAGVPHILTNIIRLATLSRPELIQLRGVSHLLCRVVDQILCKHVAINFRTNDADFATPEGDRIPGLRFEKGSARAVRERCKALVANVRILDHQGGNAALLKTTLSPHTVRRLTFASDPSSRPSAPVQLNQRTQIDVIKLFYFDQVRGYNQKTPLPFQPGARARLTEKSVQHWILQFQYHSHQPRLSQTFFELEWPGNGPAEITLILQALPLVVLEAPPDHEGSSRRLGLLHDLVLLIAANRHIQWTLVVDTLGLPPGALCCSTPEKTDSAWLAEAVSSMAMERPGVAGGALNVYTWDDYRDVVGEETFKLRTTAPLAVG